jgi:hypothetical protein
LATWIRNNWRPIGTTIEQKSTTIMVNPLNVVWELHRAKVEQELKSMLEMTSLNLGDLTVFERRTTACKNILERMDVEERAAFDAIVQGRRTGGNPANTQRA